MSSAATSTAAVTTLDQRDYLAALDRARFIVLMRHHSPATRRNYQRALRDFFAWLAGYGYPPLDRALVIGYVAEWVNQGGSPSSINQALPAIKQVARELVTLNILSDATATSIAQIHSVKQQGVRSGNWLSQAQAQRLLELPDATTLRGARDRALLALLVGGFLRRSEAAALKFSHLQQREGRWAIVDICGKGRRVRTVPIPSWVKVALDEWAERAGIGPEASGGRETSDAYVFRRGLRRWGRLTDEGREGGAPMAEQTVYGVVTHYAPLLGVSKLAPHDLRRTGAKLAHKGGAKLEQIQIVLGHAEMATTERYLGVDLDFTDAPADHLGLRLG